MSDTHRSPRTLSRLAAFVAAGLFAFTVSAFAQTQPEAVIVPNRVTQAINPDQRVTLMHNVHPLAKAQFDQGAAPGSMSTGRIMLVLKRSDTQEQALKQYLGDLQDPNSPNYRKWLTPEQYGQLYGISDTDLTTVTAWLQSQGFTVDKIPAARNVVIFSGNVAQIQQAFHTSIHKYFVNGEQHFANSADPQIPAALAPVIAGVAQLNDFRPKRGAVVNRTAHFDPDSKKIKPDLSLNCTSAGCTFPGGSGGNVLFTTPADAATIYDTPIQTLNAGYSKVSSLVGGKTYDGSGVTIGIAGDADVNIADINNYRAAFLPASYAQFQQNNIVTDGNDPGINGDSIEAMLDLEVSGGIAPGATVKFYNSASTDFQEGLFLAIYRALDDNAVSILNVSFGLCEAFEGSGANAQILQAWQQAAAQGISVTVSTGDSGSAGCDDSNSVTSASNGLAVSGLASTPYNIAVGGTDYNVLGSDFSTYVNSSNAASSYYRTALSYIPENPWNNSPTTNNGPYTSNTPFTGSPNITGAGGGISSCTQSNGSVTSCVANSGYAQPAFQKSVTNAVSATSRSLPDISLLAANGAYGAIWTVCSDNEINGSSTTSVDCQQSGGGFTSGTTFSGVGGTSASAPAFAGMLALVLQEEIARTGNASLRLGQANNVLYNLAAQTSLYPTVFHDVTTGNNSVVCAASTPDCGTNSFLKGYNAGAGYDAASGLGSVDVTQLIANWKKAAFTSTSTSLAISGGGASIPHGTQLTLNATVSPNTATGDVSFINDSGVANNGSLVPQFQTLSNGTASLKTGDLPGGTFNVYAYYGGDVKNAASRSNPIPVTITPEQSVVAIGAYIYEPINGTTLCDDFAQNPISCSGVTAPYGYVTAVSGQVQGQSGSGTVATGSIAFTDSAGNLTYNGAAASPVNIPISSVGLASYNNYQFQDQSLSVASHGISGAYSGDASYQSSNSGGSFPVKVTQGQTQTSASATQKGTTVTLLAQVDTDSIGAFPTGTVTFKNGSTTLGSTTTASAVGFASNGTGKGTTAAAQFTIQVSSSQISALNQTRFPWTIPGGAAALACVFFLAIPARRRSWRTLLGLIVFAGLISGMMACGGGSSNGGGGGGGGGTGTITAVYSGDANYSGSTSTAVTVTTSSAQVKAQSLAQRRTAR